MTNDDDNPVVPVAGVNQSGPTQNTQARTAARRTASTNAAVTSYTTTAITAMPDILEEEIDGVSDEDSINQIDDMGSDTDAYMTDEVDA